jgi:peroxiredoxin
MKNTAHRALLVFLLIGTTQALAAVPDDPTLVLPIEPGSEAPAFVAKEVDGRLFRFDPAHLSHPVLLIFYRGGWCPYCNAHLHDLQSVEPKIVALGYRVLFLSTDRPEILYSSLKERVNYHLLSDSGLDAARAFGIAYRLDDASFAKMKSFGVDLEAAQGQTLHQLPVPSVFIVDHTGIVRFRYFNPDFRVRLDAASVLAAAQNALIPL